jgi:hypothetical protein
LPANNGAGAGEVSCVPAACRRLVACQWRMGCRRHFSRASALLQWVRAWLTLLGGLITATVRFCWLDDPTNVADWMNADRCGSAPAREKWCWRRRGVGCTCCMRAIGGVSVTHWVLPTFFAGKRAPTMGPCPATLPGGPYNRDRSICGWMMLAERMRSGVGARLPPKMVLAPERCRVYLLHAGDWWCQWRMGCLPYFSRASALLQWVRAGCATWAFWSSASSPTDTRSPHS